IRPAPSKAPLKQYKGTREVSRNAVYRISHAGSPAFNADNPYLLSGEDGTIKPHAFHSALDADKPHIIIKLDQPRRVRYLRIRNRLRSHQHRAAGLTVWLSTDGEEWQKAWQAEAVKDEWLVDLGGERRCSHIKIGLPRKGTLHLYKVVAYGR
ncbi:MAG: hypothetical protein ACODAJ_10295, partial [Planctomycetota bacterium]